MSKNFYYSGLDRDVPPDVGILYEFRYAEVTMYNIPYGLHDVVIKYTYKTEDVVQQFNNTTMLRLNNNTNLFSKINYNIILPKNSNVFKINSKKMEINKVSDNEYNLEISKKISDKYIELTMDKEIINQGKRIDQNIELYKVKKLFNNDRIQNFVILIIFGILTLILFFIVTILTRKIDVIGYVRETEKLVDPILAESIIDRKIGAKELIMSCIVELIYRKKLKNIGDDAVEIVDLNQISEYEKEIIELVFNGKNRITFDEIKMIFLRESVETKKIYEKLKRIKQKIVEMLYDYNIYSVTGDRILKIIRIFSALILLAMGYLVSNMLLGYDLFEYGIILTVFGTFALTLKKSKYDFKEIGSKIMAITYVILCIICMLIGMILYFKEHIIIVLGVILITIINIFIIRKTKLHVFTKSGKIEYSKVVGLKNYIVDYSLMEQRDLESVIIWDEYLAYSVAFGISNKISRKFSENLMEANIIIQKIDEILYM